MAQLDFLIVGAGLYGAVFAHQAGLRGKRCLVIDKRSHLGGNAYCKTIENINVHAYGAHIFHTNDKEVWDYVNSLHEFNRYTHSPLANYKGELYNLPFTMNTFHQLWGVKTPQEAKEKLAEQCAVYAHIEPKNLEEQALKLVGKEIYEKLVKSYTEKQWGRDASEISAFVIKRLPLRFTFDNNYFNDTYQGIPVDGYNRLIEKMLEKAEVRLNTDFFSDRVTFEQMADKVVYTGMIDEYFSYCFGQLEYRSLQFEHELLPISNYQGVAVMNYTDSETPYTRIIEHKHFEFGTQDKTVITREYPQDWDKGKEPYYPINDDKNNTLFAQYKEKAATFPTVIFGGRLADYAYYDMDKVIRMALDKAK